MRSTTLAAIILVMALVGCDSRTALEGDDGGAVLDTVAQPDFGPPSAWAASLGGASIARGNGIAVGSGRVHVAGTQSTGAKGENVLLARVKKGGASDWTLITGGSLRDAANAIALDPSGNAMVTGVYSVKAIFGTTTLTSSRKNDIFVAKVNPKGETLWVVSAGGTSGEDSLGVATDHSGNVFITGSFSGVARFGNMGITSQGKEDVFVAKLNSAGQFVWAVAAGGASGDYGAAIAVDSGGGLYITGSFTSKAAFGKTTLTSKGALDLFVARLDPTGDFKWATSGGGKANVRGRGISVDKLGLTVTGDFIGNATFGSSKVKSRGQTDVLVARLESSGAFAWATSAGGTKGDSGTAVASDNSGKAMVTGYFEGKATFGVYNVTSAGSYDIFAAPLNVSGTFSKTVSAGGPKDDYGYAVAMDGSGASYLTGSFKGTATFDKTKLSATGVESIFVWSLGR